MTQSPTTVRFSAVCEHCRTTLDPRSPRVVVDGARVCSLCAALLFRSR